MRNIFFWNFLKGNGALIAFAMLFLFSLVLMILPSRSFGCAACAGRMDDSNVQSFVPRGANGKPIYYSNGQSSESGTGADEKVKKDAKKSKETLEKEKTESLEDKNSQKKTESP